MFIGLYLWYLNVITFYFSVLQDDTYTESYISTIGVDFVSRILSELLKVLTFKCKISYLYFTVYRFRGLSLFHWKSECYHLLKKREKSIVVKLYLWLNLERHE